MKYKRLNPHYVWCDFHGEIHEHADVYLEGEPENCGGINWRKVYVETDDKDESFA